MGAGRALHARQGCSRAGPIGSLVPPIAPQHRTTGQLGHPARLRPVHTPDRHAFTVALTLAVVCGMLAAREGLGNWIVLSFRFFKAPDPHAGVMVLGPIGYSTSALLAALERRVLAWRSSS